MIEDLIVSICIILFFMWFIWTVLRVYQAIARDRVKVKLAEAEARKYEAADKLTKN